jgi:pimeloyl-ACP methyl ester carboxylesterase
MSKNFSEIIEKQSSQKKVTLLQHDWGSMYGYLVARDRPDLVSRIASIDVGPDDGTNKIDKLF